jgi:hypothetical protein
MTIGIPTLARNHYFATNINLTRYFVYVGRSMKGFAIDNVTT